ncbi:AsnC family transcriptional regulator, partial [Lactonifactor longoviformis]
MDKLDKEILKILSQNGRTSFKQISEAVGLTSPAVKTRIE